jgi:hypothetical protein
MYRVCEHKPKKKVLSTSWLLCNLTLAPEYFLADDVKFNITEKRNGYFWRVVSIDLWSSLNRGALVIYSQLRGIRSITIRRCTFLRYSLFMCSYACQNKQL